MDRIPKSGSDFDLDLVFIDYKPPRAQVLGQITEALRQTAERLRDRGFQTHATVAIDASELVEDIDRSR